MVGEHMCVSPPTAGRGVAGLMDSLMCDARASTPINTVQIHRQVTPPDLGPAVESPPRFSPKRCAGECVLSLPPPAKRRTTSAESALDALMRSKAATKEICFRDSRQNLCFPTSSFHGTMIPSTPRSSFHQITPSAPFCPSTHSTFRHVTPTGSARGRSLEIITRAATSSDSTGAWLGPASAEDDVDDYGQFVPLDPWDVHHGPCAPRDAPFPYLPRIGE